MSVEVKLFRFPILVDNRNLHNSERLEALAKRSAIKDNFKVNAGKAPVPDLGFIGIYDDGSGVFFSNPTRSADAPEKGPDVIEQIGLFKIHPIYLPETKLTSRIYGVATVEK